MDTRELLQALSDPAAYPHGPDRVEVRQTHISLLFFAGERVYKVKKGVRLGFLDFSSAERRLHFCREEVRLNAALASGVYLGVAPVVRGEGGRVRVGEVYREGEGPRKAAIEHAVAMRRLPGERMLEAMLERGEIDNAVIDRLVEVLAAFHASAATGEGVDEHGHPDAVARRLMRNLEECVPLAGGVVSPLLLAHLRRWQEGMLTELRALMQRRVLEGRVREGHGDLHAGNICVLEDRIVIYDRIEFAPGFRCADVASEVAFLAMDLDARGYRGLGGYLAARYAQRTGDEAMARLLPLYKSHLAAVRGKVAAIRSREGEGGEVAEEQRAAAGEEARRYFCLAAAYGVGPSLVLTCGLPGTGKSSAARAVAGPLGAVILQSDIVRKRLAGMGPTERYTGPIDEGLYGAESTERTYAELLAQARGHLSAGRSVVVDATFRSAAQRRPFLELAEGLGVPGVVAHITCPEEEVERRLARRKADAGEVSDADMRIYRHLKGSFEAPAEVGADRVAHLTCAMKPGEAASALLNRLVGIVG